MGRVLTQGPVFEQLTKQASGLDNWLVTRYADSYNKAFEDSRDSLVYLTAGVQPLHLYHTFYPCARLRSACEVHVREIKRSMQILRSLSHFGADSPNELDALDASKAYIIGGIVDRNRHKNVCLRKAQAEGIATARLPISPHLKLLSSSVITVNQVGAI